MVGYENRPNLRSEIAQLVVDRGRVWELHPDLPWGIRLATRVTVSVNAEEGRTQLPVNLGFPFPDPEWLSQSDKVRAAFYVGGAVAAEGVVSYDARAGTVTALVTDAAGELQVDVLMPGGVLEVAKSAPLGHSGTRERVVGRWDVRRLHLVDQQRSPVRVDGRHVLIQDWQLRWYLDAPYVVAWDSPLTQVLVQAHDESLAVWEQALRQVPPELGGPYSLQDWAQLETANW